jgi:hypothetical protein
MIRYSIFNHDWKFGNQEIKAVPTDYTFAKELYAKIGELLAAGKFKPNPVKKLGGLESVQQGFKDAESNKVYQTATNLTMTGACREDCLQNLNRDIKFL